MATWSEEAKIDYWGNIDYLLDQWPIEVAERFVEKVENIIMIIDKTPRIFQKSDYRNIHFVPIVPQITLFYRVNEYEEVELVRFWNNKKNPSTRNL